MKNKLVKYYITFGIFIAVMIIFSIVLTKECKRKDYREIIIQGTDVFGAKAYVVPVNENENEFTVDCKITNLTSDRLSVKLTEKFFLTDSSNLNSPTAVAQEKEIIFAPNESKQFYFDVEAFLTEEKNNKVIYGSCVLEITNSDKYEYYNVLRAEPCSIERISYEKNN